MSDPLLDRILESNLCAGCGLCAGVAPDRVEMSDSSGWLRPLASAELEPEQKAIIERCCPALVIDHRDVDAPVDVLWGAMLNAEIGWSTDDALRRLGSSGGSISAIAHALMTDGSADVVVHVGAPGDRPTHTSTEVSSTPVEIGRNAGSRYASSAPLVRIIEEVRRGNRVVAIGKPCDISALRALAREDDEISERVVATLSFLCAGVPSRAGTDELLNALGTDESNVAAFRYRGDGWPGQVSATLHSGETRSMSYTDSWGRILNRYLQHRCKVCPDGVGEAADIACGDAWHSDDRGYPIFDDRPGRSLILTRTRRGAEIMSRLKRTGDLSTEPIDTREIAAMQPFQVERKRAILARLAGQRLALRAIPRYRGMRLLRNALVGGLAFNVRNGVGMFRRVKRDRHITQASSR